MTTPLPVTLVATPSLPIIWQTHGWCQTCAFLAMTRSPKIWTISLDLQPLLWYNTHMENSKRKQRTPEEIIAETEARLERLRVRQAKAEAKSNPAVASLMDAKAALAKEVREAKKLLGDGPQSANARIEKHEAWIEKINDQVIEAESDLFSAEARLVEIDTKIAEAISGLVSSKEISAEA
jgi:chromosome segregation ATPase